MTERTAHTDPTTWIPILVRRQDYAEVAALILELETRRGPGQDLPSVDSGAAPTIDPDDVRLESWTPWPLDQLRAFSQATSLTAQRWTRAMDVCCAAVGTERYWLSTSEVAERAGMTVNEWRDAPRKLTRHLKANYPDLPRDPEGGPIWPLMAMGKPGSPEVHWAMNHEQAKRWREVRGDLA